MSYEVFRTEWIPAYTPGPDVVRGAPRPDPSVVTMEAPVTPRVLSDDELEYYFPPPTDIWIASRFIVLPPGKAFVEIETPSIAEHLLEWEGYYFVGEPFIPPHVDVPVDYPSLRVSTVYGILLLGGSVNRRTITGDATLAPIDFLV